MAMAGMDRRDEEAIEPKPPEKLLAPHRCPARPVEKGVALHVPARAFTFGRGEMDGPDRPVVARTWGLAGAAELWMRGA